MSDMSFNITVGTIIQLSGYVIVAVGLYLGIKLDLQSSRIKAESAKTRADEAHSLAGDAHDKIYEHVADHAQIHQHHRNKDTCEG